MSALLRKHIKKPAKAMQSLVEIAECQTGAAVLRAVDQCRNPDLYTKTFTRNAQPGSAEAEKILRKQDRSGAKQTVRNNLMPKGNFAHLKMEAQTGNCRFCTKRGEVKILKACPCKLVEYCNRACQRNDCTLLLRECFLFAYEESPPHKYTPRRTRNLSFDTCYNACVCSLQSPRLPLQGNATGRSARLTRVRRRSKNATKGHTRTTLRVHAGPVWHQEGLYSYGEHVRL